MDIILSVAVSFVVCLLLTPFLIKLFVRLRMIDEGGGRKIHKGIVPTMGGTGVFIAIMSTLAIMWDNVEMNMQTRYVIGAISVMFLLGFTDDAIDLRASRKLFVMIIVASLVYMSGIRIDSLFGFFGVYGLPSGVSYAVTVFTIIVVTNAFNLIDGIDGLAGGIGIVSMAFFALWFVLSGDKTFAILCSSIVGALAAFLRYNWAPARIFMGDTGSLFIGMISAICAIKFINQNIALDPSDPLKFKGAVAAGCVLVMYPMYDTLRVFIIRMLEGRSPMSPDTRHTHHYLLRFGFSHSKATMVILIADTVAIIFFGVLSYFVTSFYVVPLMLLTSLAVSLWLKRRERQIKHVHTAI